MYGIARPAMVRPGTTKGCGMLLVDVSGRLVLDQCAAASRTSRASGDLDRDRRDASPLFVDPQAEMRRSPPLLLSHPNKKGVFVFTVQASVPSWRQIKRGVFLGFAGTPRRSGPRNPAAAAAPASLRFHPPPAGAAPSKTPSRKSSARARQRKCRLQRGARRSRHVSLWSGPSSLRAALKRELPGFGGFLRLNAALA